MTSIATVTTRRRFAALAIAVLAAAAPAAAIGWEAATTHAGLTEQAAIASGLHERLARDFGLEQGLYAELEVPEADAPDLLALLRRFSPSEGFVPDGRGRMRALGWLVAGSAVADTPASHFASHFHRPSDGRGAAGAGVVERLRMRLAGAVSGGALPGRGLAAVDWLVDRKNPMSVAAFWQQYDRAVLARTPAERARHLAGALTAAGALLHVLEDMGSPSHARGDLRAHANPLSNLTGDRGSRFERLAALAYGRLGVPPAGEPPPARPLKAYLTAADGSGLADRTAAGFLSAYTLPADRSIERGVRSISARELGLPAGAGGIAPAADLTSLGQRRGHPSETVWAMPVAPASPVLDLAMPNQGTLRNARGVCLANYRFAEGRLSFELADDCALEQIAALLPDVASYARGMLDHLFRGSLTLTADGPIAVSAGSLGLGRGTLTVLWDDAAGVRTTLGEVAVQGAAAGQLLGSVPAAPAGAARLTALFRGVDAAGEPLSATGTLSLTP